ncbi:MAG: class I SAM-dependent methyltransferase [Thermaerobacterales bacterium]
MSSPVIWAAAAAGLALAGVMASIVWSSLRGGAWWPTPQPSVIRMLTLADLRPGQRLIDLGAGDGRILVAAAREFRAHATGVEIDAMRARYVNRRLAALGLADRAQIYQGDMFAAPFHEVDVVTAVVSDAALSLLLPILQAQMQPGARLATYKKRLPGVKLIAHDPSCQVYIWDVHDETAAAAD